MVSFGIFRCFHTKIYVFFLCTSGIVLPSCHQDLCTIPLAAYSITTLPPPNFLFSSIFLPTSPSASTFLAPSVLASSPRVLVLGCIILAPSVLASSGRRVVGSLRPRVLVSGCTILALHPRVVGSVRPRVLVTILAPSVLASLGPSLHPCMTCTSLVAFAGYSYQPGLFVLAPSNPYAVEFLYRVLTPSSLHL